MDCSVCTSMPVQLRPPRNTICGTCFEGARSLISFINKLEAAQGIDKANLCKNLMNVSTWVLDMKDSSEELDEKINFLSGLVVAFRNQIHTDIQIRSGENRPPIPAHRALLAIRSEIFSNMLDSDGCKAPPIDDTITLPELNHEELESFLELLYSGDLTEETMSKHVYSISLAADKYGISYLQKLCERYMHKFLSSSNALDVLEVADTCSFLTLKENALNYIVKNMQEIVFSAKYDTFALKNPHLSVQITRASLMDAKRNCVGRLGYSMQGMQGAAKTIISVANKFKGAKGSSLKTLTDVSKWLTTPLEELKEIPELREKIRFLSFSSTFKDQIDTDKLVRSGDKGSAIPAHKAILRSRSEDFNNRLGSSEECKPLRKKGMDFIVLPELKHDELESFIEFIYTAELPEDKMNKHVYALSLAADKYQIPYLLKFCERHLIKNLSLNNALDVLEITNVRSYLALVKNGALEFIVKNKGDILFSAKYEALALNKNPRLCMQITRAFAE